MSTRSPRPLERSESALPPADLAFTYASTNDAYSRRLTNRLTAQRLFVAHQSVERQFAQHTRDHVLRHPGRPDRTHHERGHHAVSPEIRREVRQPSHELLARREELRAHHLTLEPRLGVEI